jgi:Bacteriophage T4-like portal protein (Gp20)
MAKFSGYYKIVTPSPETTKVTDSQSLGDQGAYGNYTWYQRLVQGSASRLTRYREYDIMDNDVDISRALDIIAEEMTGNNPKTKMPIELEIMSEKETSIEDTTVLTLRAAQRYWTQLHGWDHRLFKAARVLIKYGDCFFKRKSISSKWEFVHPKNIIAAVVDEEDITRIIGWQIKNDIKKSRTSYGSPLSGVGDYGTEYLSSEEVVRFTLNDDLSESAPFGESLLKPVYRTFKQKELLEDSIIIYRIQRAPERRVF